MLTLKQIFGAINGFCTTLKIALPKGGTNRTFAVRGNSIWVSSFDSFEQNHANRTYYAKVAIDKVHEQSSRICFNTSTRDSYCEWFVLQTLETKVSFWSQM